MKKFRHTKICDSIKLEKLSNAIRNQGKGKVKVTLQEQVMIWRGCMGGHLKIILESSNFKVDWQCLLIGNRIEILFVNLLQLKEEMIIAIPRIGYIFTSLALMNLGWWCFQIQNHN